LVTHALPDTESNAGSWPELLPGGVTLALFFASGMTPEYTLINSHSHAHQLDFSPEFISQSLAIEDRLHGHSIWIPSGSNMISDLI